MGRLLYAVAASAALCAPAYADHVEPNAAVQGEMDPELRATIERVVGQTDRPIENRFEARRRARAAAEDAIAVLRSEGYYAYEVTPDVTETEPPQPVVDIKPGPRFGLGAVTVDWQGGPPDPETDAAAKGALKLNPGEPGRAADIIAGEGRILAAVQKRGYADAAAGEREVIVDHADHTVRPTYRVSAGPLVKLDGLSVSDEGRTSPAWLAKLTPWTSGDTYDPDDVAELERRLLDTGVYDSVTVALAPPDKSVDGLRPVVVSLAERKPRTIEAGASYSSSEGPGVSVRWTRYNRLRRADTVSLLGQLSDRDSRLQGEVSLPHWRRPQQTLKAGASIYRLETDAYDENGVEAHADATRRRGKTSYLTLGGSITAAKSTELKSGTLSTIGRNLVTVAALGDLLWDRSNDPLSPTSGYKLSARLEPTLIVGDTNLPYLRAVAQGSYYLPLDKTAKTVVAARLRLGRILNGTVDQIPASQRFYAGGGGSVRGFPYQGVGPRLADGTPQGGIFLAESSLEMRRELTARWGVALFVDAGTVGTSSGAPNFDDLAAGAGFGIRYNLGFAPIRVDFATPVLRRRGEAPLQVYLSIGQSF